MYKMLQVKVDCLARNLNFQKNTLKTSPNYKQLWDILALKIDGCQTVDTRSTFGVPLKSLGYNGSNELLGRSVASKLSLQQACKKKCERQWNFVKNGNFLLFGLQLENEERYCDGS